MSLEGNATGNGLRGKINSIDVLTIDAYGVAVRNGYKGTVDEWLGSLKGEKGDTGDAKKAFIAYVDLTAAGWQGEGNLFYQVVSIDGANECSKVDLNPTVEQLAIFKMKDLTFVTENEDGVITVYCIGQKPQADYTMQVTVTEVLANG